MSTYVYLKFKNHPLGNHNFIVKADVEVCHRDARSRSLLADWDDGNVHKFARRGSWSIVWSIDYLKKYCVKVICRDNRLKIVVIHLQVHEFVRQMSAWPSCLQVRLLEHEEIRRTNSFVSDGEKK